MITCLSISFEDFLGSSIASQVMPPWSPMILSLIISQARKCLITHYGSFRQVGTLTNKVMSSIFSACWDLTFLFRPPKLFFNFSLDQFDCKVLTPKCQGLGYLSPPFYLFMVNHLDRFCCPQIWDVVILVAILYVAVIVPFNAAFNRHVGCWVICWHCFAMMSFVIFNLPGGLRFVICDF